MGDREEKSVRLPSPAELRLAIRLYLEHAYRRGAPASAKKFIPPDDADTRKWLLSDLAERTPPDAPLEAVRSFALRIGNDKYPYMKLRVSRPPNEPAFLFTVDCHDNVLRAAPGSPYYEPLQAMKRHNAVLAKKVVRAWEAAGLPTERRYLRNRIRQARRRQ